MISLIKEFEGVYTTTDKQFQVVNEQEMTIGLNIDCWAVYDLKNPRMVENLIRAIPVAEFTSLDNARKWINDHKLN